ncbi:DUF4367 domain-containing protein [Clostridium boliviensis]|uniref:DUF4367 domain-containing protein n=1 Tax=Clostridium boliviensis TaxID=318465 RepID=A0ABU4GI35_9CLOT|nr:DUF4367 domain-containing protein [Clostridium boliviensis]MDW2797275.1 DUF4367 domain-containing protein [Clostridium boliviensis]
MTSENRNKELFDSLLKAAISDALRDEMDALPSNKELNEEFPTSVELDKRIEKLISKHKMKSKIRSFIKSNHKTAACFIVIIVLSSATLLSVEATRNVILNAFVNQFGKYTQIQYEDSKDDEQQMDIFRPSYLPEGYKKISEELYGNSALLVYSDESETEIVLKQRKAEDGTALIDNENTNYTEVDISGNTAYLFKTVKDDNYNVLLWKSRDVVFELTSKINSDELIRIGRSMEK